MGLTELTKKKRTKSQAAEAKAAIGPPFKNVPATFPCREL